jgi:hypothetical protein
MIDFIPYFAGLITLIFGVAFSYATTDGWNFKSKKK